jgi:DNA-binding response OmpR family regulator
MAPEKMKPTILLVEDDFVLRTSLAELFMSQGFDVDCAAHGLEAFHRLNSSPIKPSVIVLDLMMPHMDGFEFRALQRSLPSYSDVPVVIITANSKVTLDVARLGVREMFYKPVNTWRLLDTVRALSRSTPN